MHIPCLPLCPSFSSAGSRILIFLLALLTRSPDYLYASHYLQDFSKFDIYLNVGGFLMQSSQRSSIFLHFSCLSDISPPIT